jgi:hypothetical protein
MRTVGRLNRTHQMRPTVIMWQYIYISIMSLKLCMICSFIFESILRRTLRRNLGVVRSVYNYHSNEQAPFLATYIPRPAFNCVCRHTVSQIHFNSILELLGITLTVDLLLLLSLKMCLIRSTFLNNAYVVECPLLKPYWLFLITFSFKSWKFSFSEWFSQKVYLRNVARLLVYTSVGTRGVYLLSEA